MFIKHFLSVQKYKINSYKRINIFLNNVIYYHLKSANIYLQKDPKDFKNFLGSKYHTDNNNYEKNKSNKPLTSIALKSLSNLGFCRNKYLRA